MVKDGRELPAEVSPRSVTVKVARTGLWAAPAGGWVTVSCTLSFDAAKGALYTIWGRVVEDPERTSVIRGRSITPVVGFIAEARRGREPEAPVVGTCNWGSSNPPRPVRD